MCIATRVERERLIGAMLEELEKKGYRGAEIELDPRRAGLGGGARHSADASDKEARLLAAHDWFVRRLHRAARLGSRQGGPWPERVFLGLDGVLRELAASPELARALTRVFPAVGPQAHARHRRLVEGFAALLGDGREFCGPDLELPREAEMLAVGAAEAIVIYEIDAGRAARLPELAPAILFSVLVPFLGPEAAGAAMLEARETGSRGGSLEAV